MKPQDKTDIRPILVTVGLLLAPDDFQMILDADNTPESTEPFLTPHSFTHKKGFPLCI